MAAGVLAKPGSEFGPCAKPCRHTDCTVTRQMAESLCHRCDGEIGYEKKFYRDTQFGRTYLVHALCEEDAIREEA